MKRLALAVGLALVAALALSALADAAPPPASAQRAVNLGLGLPPKHILFFSIPLPGHMNPLLAQASRLVEMGYQVTVASAKSFQAYVDANKHPRVRFLGVGDCAELDRVSHVMQEAAKLPSFGDSSEHIYEWVNRLHPCLYPPLVNALAPATMARDQAHPGAPAPASPAPPVQADSLPAVDLMVIDASSNAAVDVANELKIPFVVNNPDLLYLLSPRLVPPLDVLPLMFQERSAHARQPLGGLLTRWLLPPVRALVSLYILRGQTARLNALRALSGLTTPYDPFTVYSGRLIIQNTAFGLEHPQYVPPNVHLVGPCIQPNQRERLSDADQAWLDGGSSPSSAASAASPVVFVSMGTIAPLDGPQMRKLLQGFVDAGVATGALRVLWKLAPAQQETLYAVARELGIALAGAPMGEASTEGAAGTGPAEGGSPVTLTLSDAQLRVTQWVSSQTGVLQHPRTKVFLSHCGINSAYETALLAGGRVMMLCIPMFGDQLDMAQRVRDAGLGAYLDKDSFTPSQVADGLALLLRLLTSSQWVRRGELLRETVAMAGGLDRAVALIDYAARTYPHKAAEPLAPEGPVRVQYVAARPGARSDSLPASSSSSPSSSSAASKEKPAAGKAGVASAGAGLSTSLFVDDAGLGLLGEGLTGVGMLTTADASLSWVQWAGVDVLFAWALLFLAVRVAWAATKVLCGWLCCCWCSRRSQGKPAQAVPAPAPAPANTRSPSERGVAGAPAWGVAGEPALRRRAKVD